MDPSLKQTEADNKIFDLPFLNCLPALFESQMESPEFLGGPFLSAQINEFPGLILAQVIGGGFFSRAYLFNCGYTLKEKIKLLIYDGPTPQISIKCDLQLEKVITQLRCAIFNKPEPVIIDNRPVEILVPAATIRYSLTKRDEPVYLNDPGVLSLFDVVRDFFGIDIKRMPQNEILKYFQCIYEDIRKKSLISSSSLK